MTEAVANLLREKGISFTPSGGDYLIKCLNPEHNDSNPSLRVDRVSGVSHCFACGWKRNIFKHFGVFTNNASIKVAKLKEKLNDLKFSMLSVEMPKGATPFTRSHRNISAQTLKEFEAFYTFEDKVWEDRLVFPIKDISGKTVVFLGRHMLADSKPKYMIQPKHVQVPLYPSKLEGSHSSIVLVEGIFDMLNLHDKGVKNAVCCFGTQTLKNNTHEKLLPFKVQGITKVFILFDGDKAGRESAKEMKPLIEEQGFNVEIIDLPDDVDPGELGIEDITSIKEYVK